MQMRLRVEQERVRPLVQIIFEVGGEFCRLGLILIRDPWIRRSALFSSTAAVFRISKVYLLFFRAKGTLELP